MTFRFRYILFLAFVLLLSSNRAYSQDTSEEEPEYVVNEDVRLLEFAIDQLSPVGNFRSLIDSKPIGFTFSFLRQRNSEKNYSFFGVQFSRYGFGGHSGVVSTTLFPFEDITNTVLVSAHVLYRQFTPFYHKSIEPFFEFGLGPNFVYTGTNTTFINDSSTEYNFEQTDLGLSYGLGAGVTIKAADQFFLVLKAHYYGGNALSFLVPDDELTTEFPVDSFRLRSSQLNYLKLQLGVTYSY